jgi:phosphoribosylglycinamide formyltransferase 1
MKLVFVVGKNGGDYFAIKKAIDNKLLENIELIYMISNSFESKAINDYKKTSENYYIKSLKETKNSFFNNMDNVLSEITYDYILLTGFDWLIPSIIVDKNLKKIINSHHSLLPAHPGLFKKEKLIESDDKFLGATLHFVDNGIDTGKKLTQAVFPNYQMKKLNVILKNYRFIQDCMIVQLMANLNTQKELNKKKSYNDILFNPPIENLFLEIFKGSYFDK